MTSAIGGFRRQPTASVKASGWMFRSQFRAGAFGWRSDLPIKRIKEAVAEIKKAARKDQVLGAEGAVIVLEKVSGALAHVDSSSGGQSDPTPKWNPSLLSTKLKPFSIISIAAATAPSGPMKIEGGNRRILKGKAPPSRNAALNQPISICQGGVGLFLA